MSGTARAEQVRAAVEILSLLAVFAVAKLALGSLKDTFITPGTVFIVTSLALIWWFQKRRGEGPDTLGLARPPSWKKFALTALGALGLTFVIGVFGVSLLKEIFPDPDHSLVPEGSTIPIGLIWLRIMITAAVGEEIVFRGFLLGRLEALFQGLPFATALAVIAQALLFGLGHYSSGAVSVIVAASIGLVFGAAFILGSRNLWPLMLVHAIPDSISLLQG